MQREKFTAWITKYALTTGIDVVEAEWCNDISESMISYRSEDSFRTGLYAHGKEWHRTQEAAVARAEEMRLAKIANLRKQMAKLEHMQFVAPSKIAPDDNLTA